MKMILNSFNSNSTEKVLVSCWSAIASSSPNRAVATSAEAPDTLPTALGSNIKTQAGYCDH